MSEPAGRSRRPGLLWVLLGILGVALAILFFNDGIGASFGLTNGDVAQVAALVAILIFVGAGVLGRPLGVGQILRSMLAWAAVILVLAGVYASRDELGGFAGRLLGALAPGLPISGTLSGEDNPDSVAIIRAADGHFAVRATIADTPMTLLVDTGASFVTLTYGDAMRTGINPDALDFSVAIRTANGAMNAASILLEDVTVGAIERRRVRALVAPPGSLQQSLLGMSFLNTLAGYSISGDRMVMTP